ncbi:NUDIX hydrolase [Effusibacillus consociatus]|uniref:Nudix hydrolase domain-containing protein n=1 Tax=Effusibacillus consociatus TaxID=1117041 RepID=A0ABV9PXV8_9BACL
MAETIKRAATMILIRNREQGRGIEVYLTKRPGTMLFLPGYYVFPGGVMQQEDQNERIFRHCVNQELGVGLSYAVTAIRECFEEVGYLLADLNEAGSGVAAEPNEIRRQLELGELIFHDWVLSGKVRLRTDLIRYYGHRITPRAVSPRRFDTRYFLSIVSLDTELLPCEREVDSGVWMDPREALEKAERGAFKMVRPTMDALADLARFENAEEAFWHGEGVGQPRPHELA